MCGAAAQRGSVVKFPLTQSGALIFRSRLSFSSCIWPANDCVCTVLACSSESTAVGAFALSGGVGGTECSARTEGHHVIAYFRGALFFAAQLLNLNDVYIDKESSI